MVCFPGSAYLFPTLDEHLNKSWKSEIMIEKIKLVITFKINRLNDWLIIDWLIEWVSEWVSEW